MVYVRVPTDSCSVADRDFAAGRIWRWLKRNPRYSVSGLVVLIVVFAAIVLPMCVKCPKLRRKAKKTKAKPAEEDEGNSEPEEEDTVSFTL